jgi:predicted HAD superfamily hydrolase
MRLSKTNTAVRRFPSFAKAITSLQGITPGHPYTILSFDVFDTLLFRRCHPEAIVEGVGRWLTRECQRAAITMRSDAMTCRERAYQKVTAEKVAQSLDQDCSLTELCRAWVEEITGGQHPDLADCVEAYEVKLEKTVCFANESLVRLLQHLKAKGFRLIYISDMYLGRHVGEILDDCGFAGIFDQGYVSGELARLKRTGSLFTYALESEGASASEVLHIGDNPINDGVRAAERGISAYVIRDRLEVRRYHALEFDWQYVKRDPEYAGVAAAAYATSAIGDRGSFAESVGARLLGPIYSTFIHGVVRRCAEEGLSNIFFVAREGSILKDMFAELAPLAYRNGNLPNTNYIGLSRRTSLLYSMNDLGIREISKIRMNTAHHSLRNVLAVLRVPEDITLAAAANCGIADIDEAMPPYYLQWGPFHQVMREPAVRSYIENLVGRSKELIDKYLEQRGVFNQHRAAIVDVGWNAQIQENVYFGMLDRTDRPQLFGFYLGTLLRAHWTNRAHNSVNGVLVDEADACWYAHAAFEFIQVLEACVRAPHGTVVDYTESPEGEVVPLFKPDSEKSRQAELRDEVTIARLQTGMRSYTARYRHAVEIFGFNDRQMVPYARQMIDRLVRFPTKEEALLFLPMNNVSDLGSDLVSPLSHGLVGTSTWKAWSKMRTVIQRSGWRYGVFAVLRLRVLQPVYGIMFRLRSASDNYAMRSGQVAAVPTPSAEYRALIWKGREDGAPVPPQSYEAELKSNERALADFGRQTSDSVGLRTLTLPLSFGEAWPQWVTSQAARTVWRLRNKSSLKMDGMRIKPLLYRAIYSRCPTLSRKIARRLIHALPATLAENAMSGTRTNGAREPSTLLRPF